MSYEILYHEDVVSKDILSLGEPDKKIIKHSIEKKLLENPEIYGKPLRTSLKNYRKLRVGDFRVIFRISKKQIKIFAILHRSIVYKNVARRI